MKNFSIYYYYCNNYIKYVMGPPKIENSILNFLGARDVYALCAYTSRGPYI